MLYPREDRRNASTLQGTKELFHGLYFLFRQTRSLYSSSGSRPYLRTASRGKRRAVWLIYVVLNSSTKNPQTICHRYRSRFGIETSYRCMRQTHAMTTSRNPTLRFFLLGVAFLILNLWVGLRRRFCQIPRRGGRIVDKTTYELQRHRQFLAQVIDATYHPVRCVLALAAPLDP